MPEVQVAGAARDGLRPQGGAAQREGGVRLGREAAVGEVVEGAE